MTAQKISGDITNLVDLHAALARDPGVLRAWNDGDVAAADNASPCLGDVANPHPPGALREAWNLGYLGLPFGCPVPKHDQVADPDQLAVSDLRSSNRRPAWSVDGGLHRRSVEAVS
jgi:hypothetical protein